MRIQDAKKLPLRGLLSRLGHEPVSERAGDVWYISPFRQEEKPSFHIHEERNAWYDFGLGSGGNVLDFALRYFNAPNVSSALRHLDDVVGGKPLAALVPTLPTAHTETPDASSTTPESSPMRVQKIQPLHHWGLLDYVKKRGIDPVIARRYLQEVYYTVREGQEKPYFALAFANRTADGKEGYEIRNAYVKGCIGKKDVSVLAPLRANSLEAQLVCFEGFFDFLSYLTWNKQRELTMQVLVLNGIAMGERAMQIIQEQFVGEGGVTEVRLYLDRDAAGRALTERFQRELTGVRVVDESGLYADDKDLNEFLQRQRQLLLAL